ncbi:MAG TPA: radical SAM family heme chaperone HemW [Candidatus Eisenbacteria bacterium]|nr:radical SAM family heme chaperone HemW [Candidatus Eisenbacteria bacterium]
MERLHSLYLHIPFCTWVCKYCDFTAYPVLQGMIPPYVDALTVEIAQAPRRYPIGPLRTVFIGGGTPSLLTPEQLARILDTIRGGIGIAADAEVTIEANPSNITPAHAEAWRRAGVTRLSIGVQSLQPNALRFLERLHSGEEALQAIRAAREAGFDNIGCDLLYGIPGVSTSDWLVSLDGVLAEQPTHVSAYELTVEPGTRLAQEVRSRAVVMPDADEQLEQYWAADRRLANAGLVHYEISNWARPGFESRHNLTYWEYRPYLGCGVGAHSLLRHDDGRSERFWNVKGIKAYIDRLNEGASPIADRETLSADRAAGEAAMIGVRLLQGTRAVDPFPSERRELMEAGLLALTTNGVRLTARGVELANQVGAAFLR